jgi:hypothetical protein
MRTTNLYPCRVNAVSTGVHVTPVEEYVRLVVSSTTASLNAEGLLTVLTLAVYPELTSSAVPSEFFVGKK